MPCPHPPPPPPFLTLPFSKKTKLMVKKQCCKVTEIYQTFFMVSIAYGEGGILGVKMRSMHLPPVIFKAVLDIIFS